MVLKCSNYTELPYLIASKAIFQNPTTITTTTTATAAATATTIQCKPNNEQYLIKNDMLI